MIEDDHPLNLRSNSSQDGEDDTIRISSKPFTKGQARELQRIQGLLMKGEVLEEGSLPLRGCYLLMIALTLVQESLEEASKVKMGLEIPLEMTCAQGALDLLLIYSSISRADQNSS